MELPSATLAVPLAFALAGAGLGGAVLTGHAPAFLGPSAAQAEPPAGWEVLETFAGEVDASVTTGSLDLRTFAGPVHLVAWDEPRYEITVLQAAREGGQRLGDAGVEVTFNEERADGLRLELLVAPTGNASVSVNGGHWPGVAVLASVPRSVSWSEVLACSGSSHALRTVFEQLFGTLFPREEEELTCVEREAPFLDGSVHVGKLNGERANETERIPFAIEGLEGGALVAFAGYGGIAVAGLRFAEATIASEYGDLAGSLGAEALVAGTEYGDVALEVVADDLVVRTEYGDVTVAVLGGGSGSYEAANKYGNVLLLVPWAEDRGYDARARTEYGEARIELRDAKVEEAGDDGGAARGAGAASLLPSPLAGQREPKAGRGHVSDVSATTEGFEAKAVQVRVLAETQYGDVVVTDDARAAGAEDEDHVR